MKYAPIIIPTCNRIIHLKRLIESLNNNNWAKYTDLYISVDFPPNEGFAVGHEEVVGLLSGVFNDSACGRLGTDEENALTFARNTSSDLASFFEELDRLIEVDDVDVILLGKDVRLHLRVPTLSLVTKMSACREQFFNGRQISHDDFPFFGYSSQLE